MILSKPNVLAVAAAVGLLVPISHAFLFCPFLEFFPTTRYTPYDQLNETTLSSANALGYDESTWNLPERNPIENRSWDQLGLINIFFACGLNIRREDDWDCWVNHYNEYSWLELWQDRMHIHAETLGWDQESWDSNDNSKSPGSEVRKWDELTPEEQFAADQFCYFKETWEGNLTIMEWSSDYVGDHVYYRDNCKG